MFNKLYGSLAKIPSPGVTLTIGLSIGKKIFTALNRMEWVFFASFLSIAFVKPVQYILLVLVTTGLLLALLALQTFLFLPELNERARRIINGETLKRSFAHMIFGIAEILKVIILLYTGTYLILKK